MFNHAKNTKHFQMPQNRKKIRTYEKDSKKFRKYFKHFKTGKKYLTFKNIFEHKNPKTYI